MHINSKLTDEVAKVSVDTVKKAKEAVTKADVESVCHETPKGVSGGYFHPDIVKVGNKAAEKDFDIEQAIKNFDDINDIETITKICDSWRGEYEKLLADFTPEKIAEMADPRAAHQNALNAINHKYENFTNKICEMHSSGANEEKLAEVFSEYIEPITKLSMETYSKIDGIPAMRAAYKGEIDFVDELEAKISKSCSFIDIQKLILDVESVKTSDPAEYEKLNKLVEEKMEEFVKKISSGESVQIEKENLVKKAKNEQQSVMKYSQMSVSDLQKEIESMSVEEVLDGEKVGHIYTVLDNLSRTDTEAYNKLNKTFEAKLTEAAG